MKFSIRHQDSYSRGELLLRSFLGIFYLIIPHHFCLAFLGLITGIANLCNFFIILFTGKSNKGIFDLNLNILNWGARYMSRVIHLLDGYPKFGLNSRDPNVVLEIPYLERPNRLTVLLRFLLCIIFLLPHFFCILFMEIAMIFILIGAWFIVLFTGKYPAGMHAFVVGFMRWVMRINAYMTFMTDTYPPFTMAETDPVNWEDQKKLEDHLV